MSAGLEPAQVAQLDQLLAAIDDLAFVICDTDDAADVANAIGVTAYRLLTTVAHLDDELARQAAYGMAGAAVIGLAEEGGLL